MLLRHTLIIGWVASILILSAMGTALADELRGHYLEARTCQVYTGPCFANGEVGQAGKEAVMAWSILAGSHQGTDLTDLKVVVIVQASNTLGFEGIDDAKTARSMILVDDQASEAERDALVAFAKEHLGNAGEHIKTVKPLPIEMELDTVALVGSLRAGDDVTLLTRKARPGDCICSNEIAYYPPLARLEHFVPGVTIEGSVTARPLGRRWSIPDTRSAYLATFRYE